MWALLTAGTVAQRPPQADNYCQQDSPVPKYTLVTENQHVSLEGVGRVKPPLHWPHLIPTPPLNEGVIALLLAVKAQVKCPPPLTSPLSSPCGKGTGI